VINPGHPLQGNPVLELKILKGIVDEIISTGPLQRYIAPVTFCGRIDHPLLD